MNHVLFFKSQFLEVLQLSPRAGLNKEWLARGLKSCKHTPEASTAGRPQSFVSGGFTALPTDQQGGSGRGPASTASLPSREPSLPGTPACDAREQRTGCTSTLTVFN